jgi:hypothetical protein
MNNPVMLYAGARRMLRRQHDLLAWLFTASADAQDAFEQQVGALSAAMGDGDEIDATRLVELRNRLNAIEAAVEVRDVYAGATTDVLDFLLRGLIDAYTDSGADAFALAPQRNGLSVWRLIRAIRNNHHHWDAWAAAEPPTKSQRYDIEPLAALMGIPLPDPLDRSPIITDVSHQALHALAASYDDLEAMVRQQAWEIIRLLGFADHDFVRFVRAETGGPP